MHDLIVIGGGPAGYLAAERASHAGMKTLLVEQREVGGVCLNEGCIPSKTLLNAAKIYEAALDGARFGVTVEGAQLNHSAVMKRRVKVIRTLVAGVKAKLKSVGAEVLSAHGEIIGRVDGGYVVKAGEDTYTTKRILIATGSSPVVPPIPGLKEGLTSGFVTTNREILELKTVPKKLVIVGGGVIGLEMCAYYAAAGSQVTVIEMLDHIAGATDKDIAEFIQKALVKSGVTFLLSHKVTGITDTAVLCEGASGAIGVEADCVLLSIGRRANVAGIGLESVNVATDRAGIITDEHMLTNQPNIYAAGDVNGKYMLAHTAYREAEVAVNHMIGKCDFMRYDANPAVIYTHPEAASVGHTAETAKAVGIDYEESALSMRYSGRFLAENDGDGLCKVLIDKKHRNIIGVHLVGPYASEIIWGAATMIETQLRVTDAREIIFPHPTVSEIIRETLWTFADR